MRKLTILIDMDDVMVDFVPAWVNYLNNRFGTKVKPEDIDDWHMKNFFPEVPGNLVYEILEEPGFWDTVKPKQGAAEHIRMLKEDGHTVCVVTASHYRTLIPKMESVLFKYFPYLKWSDVVIAKNKRLVVGDVLIDDGIHNHDGCTCECRLLMDAPHNRKFSAEKLGLIRVHSWKEIYKAIYELSNE